MCLDAEFLQSKEVSFASCPGIYNDIRRTSTSIFTGDLCSRELAGRPSGRFRRRSRAWVAVSFVQPASRS